MIPNNLTNFNKFFDSYNTPVQINWIESLTSLIGTFIVNSKIYQIKCVNRTNDIWTYKFYLYRGGQLFPDLTNYQTGRMSILSTIRQGIKYLIDTKSPKSIIFAALDESEGRKKLYWRYSKELEKEYSYSLITKNVSDKQIFFLYKNISVNTILLVLDDIVRDTLDEI